MATTPIKPLLYQPAPRWHLWGALGGAVAIHLTAVALAQKHEAPLDVPITPPATIIEATLPPPEATPPPEDIPIPAPPPPPEIKPEYVEERTLPPRPPPMAKKFTPIKRTAMSQSVGNPILDNAALSAFRQWRFRPGTVSKVRIPITFTITGASY